MSFSLFFNLSALLKNQLQGNSPKFAIFSKLEYTPQSLEKREFILYVTFSLSLPSLMLKLPILFCGCTYRVSRHLYFETYNFYYTEFFLKDSNKNAGSLCSFHYQRWWMKRSSYKIMIMSFQGLPSLENSLNFFFLEKYLISL